MTKVVCEPTAALTVLEAGAPARVVEDATELDLQEINEILLHHDRRALLFGIGAAVLCGPLALIASEAYWAIPFFAALAAGIGGLASEVARRRDAARDLGATSAAIGAVEKEMSRAVVALMVEDARGGRWRELLFRSPAAYRAALAERVHARLQKKAKKDSER